MAGADVVDARRLHHPHVLQRECVADDLDRARVGGVAGHTAELDGLSIELQHLAAVDGQFPETYLLRECLQYFLLVPDVDTQRI